MYENEINLSSKIEEIISHSVKKSRNSNATTYFPTLDNDTINNSVIVCLFSVVVRTILIKSNLGKEGFNWLTSPNPRAS